MNISEIAIVIETSPDIVKRGRHRQSPPELSLKQIYIYIHYMHTNTHRTHTHTHYIHHCISIYLIAKT